MNLRRKWADQLIRIEPGVARHTGTGQTFRVQDQRRLGSPATTMWTKLNSSSGNFSRGGPRVPGRSRK